MVMELTLYAALFLVPASFLFSQHRSLAGYLLLLGSCALITLLLYHSFRWEIIGTRYRARFCALFLVLVGISLLRNYPLLAGQLLVSAVCISCLVAILSTAISLRFGVRVDDGLEISTPLIAPKWIVAQGGNNKIHNAHRSVAAQKQALDLVVVDETGARAKGLLPQKLSNYYSYGSEVVSPINGIVAKVENSEDDLPIGTTNDANPLGNFILIHSKNRTLVLAHLLKGSISVNEGDKILAGDSIASIGNSGNTSEPHLHIHAVAGYELKEKKIISEGTPVPLFFNSRYLRKGDVVSRRQAA